MLAALFVGLILAASPTYDLSLRSEARGSTDGYGDGQLNPSLSLTVPLGHLSLLGAYQPRILLFEPGLSKKVSVYHSGQIRAEQRFGRSTRLFIDQQASYGENVFSFLVTGADLTLAAFDRTIFDRRAQLPPVLYFSETTMLGIDQAFSSKVRLSATASFMYSGGADAAARATIPVTRAPRLRLMLECQLGTHDILLLALDGYASYFSASQRSYALDTGVGWRHLFSKYSDLDVLLGAGAARDVTPQFIENRLYPYAAASIRRQFIPGARNVLEGRLNLRLAPAIDPFTGRVYLRADTFGTLTYYPIIHLGLTASLGGSIALSGPIQGEKLGFASVSVQYDFNRNLSLSTGVRGQALSGVGNVAQSGAVNVPLSGVANAVGFFAITVSDRGRF